jgi:hypothetical protein
MECKCGGSPKDAKSVDTKAGIVFEYQVCKACGRNDYGTLTVHGQLIAVGNESQRLFLAMTEETPAEPAPIDGPPWTPIEQRPAGTGLIRVRFATGGYAIERPSYFEGRWDLIDAWQDFDNGPALAASFNPRPIPPALRVGSAVPEAKRVARQMPPPRPAPESVPIGVTFSLF